MALLAKIFVFAGLSLLVLLTVIAGCAYYQIQALSLPIPQAFAIITLLLPLVTAFSTRTAYSLLRSQTARARARPLLSLTLFAFQLIYETIIVTLSLTYMVPNCRLEEQWARLRSNRDAGAIRRIQDRFNCCGFNTVVDRAWPFPHGRPKDGFGDDQCRRMFGREMPCSGPWRQAMQLNAGAFFAVAIVIFVVKSIVIIVQLSNNSSWLHRFAPLYASSLEAHPNGRVSPRRLIGESDQVPASERYHDEVDNGEEVVTDAENVNGGGSRARVEPSGLMAGDGGEQWRGEV